MSEDLQQRGAVGPASEDDGVDAPLIGDPEDEPFSFDHLLARDVSPEQWIRYEAYMAEIFQAFGMNLDTPGTRRTPERFLRAIYESTAGYEGDPRLLGAGPTAGSAR
jgi:hypothetical protein